jgi:hypothetical protein
MCGFRTEAWKVTRFSEVALQSFHTMYSQRHYIGTIIDRKSKAIKASWPRLEWHVSNLMQFLQVVRQFRFHVLTVANMKVALFWDVASCSLIDTDRHFRGTYCLHHQSSKLIWNVSLLPDYMVHHPRTEPASVQKLLRETSSGTCSKHEIRKERMKLK